MSLVTAVCEMATPATVAAVAVTAIAATIAAVCPLLIKDDLLMFLRHQHGQKNHSRYSNDQGSIRTIPANTQLADPKKTIKNITLQSVIPQYKEKWDKNASRASNSHIAFSSIIYL